MIPVSATFRAAARLSHTYATRIDLYKGDINHVYTRVMDPIDPTKPYTLKIKSGSVTSDRGSNSRLTCSFELGLQTWEDVPLDTLNYRVKVFRGIDIGNNIELVQLGEFRVDSIGRTTTRGTVNVSCVGLENYVIDAKFLTPVTPTIGQPITDAIENLIKDALPKATVLRENTRDGIITTAEPWDKERWDAVANLAGTIGAEVFVDHSGFFKIRDIPKITYAHPRFILNVGQDPLPGVVVSPSITSNRSGVFNAIVATGESTDSAIQAPYWIEKDEDQNSPTYWGGSFGKVPGFVSSPQWRTPLQCQAGAREALALALAKNREVSADILPLVYPESGDAFELILEDRTSEVHVIQSISTPLTGTTSSMTTLATKTPIGE